MLPAAGAVVAMMLSQTIVAVAAAKRVLPLSPPCRGDASPALDYRHSPAATSFSRTANKRNKKVIIIFP